MIKSGSTAIYDKKTNCWEDTQKMSHLQLRVCVPVSWGRSSTLLYYTRFHSCEELYETDLHCTEMSPAFQGSEHNLRNSWIHFATECAGSLKEREKIRFQTILNALEVGLISNYGLINYYRKPCSNRNHPSAFNACKDIIPLFTPICASTPAVESSPISIPQICCGLGVGFWRFCLEYLGWRESPCIHFLLFLRLTHASSM